MALQTRHKTHRTPAQTPYWGPSYHNLQWRREKRDSYIKRLYSQSTGRGRTSKGLEAQFSSVPLRPRSLDAYPHLSRQNSGWRKWHSCWLGPKSLSWSEEHCTWNIILKCLILPLGAWFSTQVSNFVTNATNSVCTSRCNTCLEHTERSPNLHMQMKALQVQNRHMPTFAGTISCVCKMNMQNWRLAENVAL